MRTINLIVVHCTATPEGRDVTTADIDRQHRQRGFTSIGYHYVIYRDGTLHLGRPSPRWALMCVGITATA